MKTLVRQYLNYDPNPPSIIYHYCSTQTMLSILNSNCIWLSDSTKTNDSTEIKWLLNNVSDIFSEVIEKYKSEFSSEILDKVKIIINDVMMNMVTLRRSRNITHKKNFLTCFSENGDLLSQWRAYGNDGCGVALGFNSECFYMFKNGNQYEFTKVIYNLDETRKFLHQVLYEKLKYIIMDCIENKTIEEGIFNLKIQVGMLVDSIYQEGFIFKNQHFHEENEWRLYRSIAPSNYDESDGVDCYRYSEFIEGFFSDNTKYLNNFTRSKLKFRATESDIRCYTEIGFEKIKKQIIKEIILGPKCNIDPFDLKLYLTENKYLEHIEDDSIRIKPSSIPYI